MRTIQISKAIINDQTYIALSIEKNSPEYPLILQVKGRTWRSDAKLWLIPNALENWNSFKSVFEKYRIQKTDEAKRLEPVQKLNQQKNPENIKINERQNLTTCSLSEAQIKAITRMTEQLVIQKYSPNTHKNYVSSFTEFLAYYHGKDPQSITEQDFRQYILNKIENHHISESTQNNIINAIKFYYEKVELRPRFTLYDIRPRSPKKLPGFLSKEDVERLLRACTNIKHQTILKIIYSAGLRLGELTRLKTRDILFDQGLIRVRSAKGKKDRYTILSPKVAKATQEYISLFQPNYWLFEGQDGGKYSERSVQNILKAAVIKSGVDENTTVHTLRHSFATHLIMNGIDIRTIQTYLGHESIKTTEIYTHITDKMKSQIKSPIDDLDI
jgi:site-specific recombinase XerD